MQEFVFSAGFAQVDPGEAVTYGLTGKGKFRRHKNLKNLCDRDPKIAAMAEPSLKK